MFGHTLIPLRRFPQVFPVITSILLVQTVVYIIVVSTGNMTTPEGWVKYGAYIAWRVDEGEWWRLITASFLHVNLLHFIIVGFSLYIFGPQLEWLMGRLYFLFFYITTAATSFIGYHIFEISGVHAGASGAIYGFLGFYLYLYVRRLMDPQSGKGLLIIAGINLLINLQSAMAHLLSLVMGFLLASFIIEIKRLLSRESDE